MSIQPTSLSPILAPQPATVNAPGRSGSTEFRDLLNGAIDQVELSRNAANQGVQQFLSGEGQDLHSTILSVQRADLEFEMMMQLRNKVVGAYQEVMHMQL